MGDSKNSKQQKLEGLLAQFAELLADDTEEAKSETPPPPSKGKELHQRLAKLGIPADTFDLEDDDDEELTPEQEHALAVDMAAQKLSESEAFIVIAVERQDHPKAAQGMLVPYAISHATNPAAELLATSQLSGVAARAHQELAIQAITALTEDG